MSTSLSALREDVHRLRRGNRIESVRRQHMEGRDIIGYLRNTAQPVPIQPNGGWTLTSTNVLTNAAELNTNIVIIIGQLRENRCFHHPSCPECANQHGVYIRRAHALTQVAARQGGHRICMPGSCCRGLWRLTEHELNRDAAVAQAHQRRRRSPRSNNGIKRQLRY